MLAGHVFRARDTAELDFRAEPVQVTVGLTADDYARGRLDWVLSEHRRLGRCSNMVAGCSYGSVFSHGLGGKRL